jgi:nicotinate (nicotinamide) nucleotide adenylyltransferase
VENKMQDVLSPEERDAEVLTLMEMLRNISITSADYNEVKKYILNIVMKHNSKKAELGLNNSSTSSQNKNIRKKRVAILGGSFNPITDGHLKMAAEVIHAKVADEVWITPCGSRPDKPSLKTSALDRFLMCHLAVNTTFSSSFPVKVSGVELGRPSAAPTVELLPELDRRYPEYKICFVVGSDLLEGIPGWTGGDPVKDHQWYWKREFIVISRPGYAIPHAWAQRDTVKILKPVASGGKIISSNLSSSEIRRRVTSNAGNLETVLGQTARKVEGLLPLSVNQHIAKYTLLSDIVGNNNVDYPNDNASVNDTEDKSAMDKKNPNNRSNDNNTDGEKKQREINDVNIDMDDGTSNNNENSDTLSSSKRQLTRSLTMDGNVRVGTRALNITIHRSTEGASRRRVGIFGGVFNPITDGHCKMAAECLHANAVDEVWLVPCGPRKDLPDLKTSPIDRYIMCHLAIHTTFSSNFPIKVSPIEIFEEEAFSTPSLLKLLHVRYPEIDFSFIGGSDLLGDIHNWAREIDDQNWYSKENFLIIERPEYPVSEKWKKEPNIVMIDSPIPGGNIILSNNSSSEVRRRLAVTANIDGFVPRSLEGLVPATVLNHIRRYNLYTPNARSFDEEVGTICETTRQLAYKHTIASPINHVGTPTNTRPLSPLHL